MNQTGESHRPYGTECKDHAVEMFIESGRPLKIVARDPGLRVGTLREWKQTCLGEVAGKPEGRRQAPDALAKENRLACPPKTCGILLQAEPLQLQGAEDDRGLAQERLCGESQTGGAADASAWHSMAEAQSQPSQNRRQQPRRTDRARSSRGGERPVCNKSPGSRGPLWGIAPLGRHSSERVRPICGYRRSDRPTFRIPAQTCRT